LAFDETEINKSFSKKIHGLEWLYSHLERKYIYGYQLVVICWSNGSIKLPIAWKFYKKNNKTKTELAIDLLSYVLAIIPNPRYILFDSFYASEKILKFINSRNLKFYTQIKKNRLLDNRQIQLYSPNRDKWTRVGRLKGNLFVKVVKNHRKYYITNDIERCRSFILRTYVARWFIEEVFRFCKSMLNMDRCQMIDQRSQSNTVGVCFYLYAVLQDIAANTQMTVYEVKQVVELNRSLNNFTRFNLYFDTLA
jgi:hypothetical protein